jgi:hypothetical protein
MLNRDACERRVYRLATLLTGNPNAATKVIAHVVDAQPDLRQIDSAHMDRLTVLRSREIKPATIVSDLVPEKIAAGLSSLSPQQREAYIFSRVYRLNDREISRAMDCSVTATQRHLEQADAAMAEKLGNDASHAAATLRAYTMAIDVPWYYHVQRRRQRHARQALMLLGFVAIAMLIAALFMWWSRPLSPG